MVHSLLFEAYKLVYFSFLFFFLHNSSRLAYAICELYMFFQLLIISKVYLLLLLLLLLFRMKNFLASARATGLMFRIFYQILHDIQKFINNS